MNGNDRKRHDEWTSKWINGNLERRGKRIGNRGARSAFGNPSIDLISDMLEILDDFKPLFRQLSYDF